MPENASWKEKQMTQSKQPCIVLQGCQKKRIKSVKYVAS